MIGKRELAMRHRHPAALVFGGFLALAAAIGIGRFAYTPILPYMVEGLGISKSEAGLLASANFLGYLLGALGAAKAAVPGSRRFWLLSALAASAVTTMAMALKEAIHLFLLFRFAGGVASALVMVFGSALILDRLPVRSEWAAGLYAGVGFGIAISALTVSGFASNDSDWQRPWVMSGVVSACAVAAICYLVPRQEERPPPSPGKPTAEGEGAVRQLVIAYGLFGFGYVVTATFVSDMMRENSLLRPAEHVVWLCVGSAGDGKRPFFRYRLPVGGGRRLPQRTRRRPLASLGGGRPAWRHLHGNYRAGPRPCVPAGGRAIPARAVRPCAFRFLDSADDQNQSRGTCLSPTESTVFLLRPTSTALLTATILKMAWSRRRHG